MFFYSSHTTVDNVFNSLFNGIASMLTTGQYCYRRGEGCWESTTGSYWRTQLGAPEACIFQQTETSQNEEISSIVPLVLDHVLKVPLTNFVDSTLFGKTAGSCSISATSIRPHGAPDALCRLSLRARNLGGRLKFSGDGS